MEETYEDSVNDDIEEDIEQVALEFIPTGDVIALAYKMNKEHIFS